ncbi:acylneuraminate cytidylyltransferase family protein [Candidatus Pelagibacter sp.]|nr:acylneuraminate cytidylyltransferase family protein [Candidatus Pelagibacter sp.]
MRYRNLNILAIIPARSGSKSIKNKNVIPYKGKPLIYHSIRTALKSRLINKVIVSTDSKKYKKLSVKFGAEVPFLRPKKISSDNSIDYDYILHATKYLIKNNYFPDLIVLLRPSTPNRDKDIVDKGIKYFIKNIHSYDSMRSVSEFNQPVQKFFMIRNKRLNGYFDKDFKGEYHAYPRQKFAKTYLPNGYVDIFKPKFFLNSKKKLHGKMCPFITKETLDIDDKNDLSS